MNPISAISPIGIDLGSRFIRAAQCAGGRLVCSCRIPRADLGTPGPGRELSAEQAQTLAEILYRRGMRGSRVVVAAPAPRQFTLPMQLPPRSSGAPLDAIARSQLAEAARCDGDLLEMAWWHLPAASAAKPQDATWAMSVGARRNDVESLIAPFEAAGLLVLAVDVKAAAVLRACREHLGPATAVTAIVDFGHAGVGMSMVHKGVIVYERLLAEAGLSAVERTLSTELGIEPDVAQHVITGAGLSAAAGEAASWTLLPQARELMRAHLEHTAAEIKIALDYAVGRYGGPSAPAPVLLVTGVGAGAPGFAEEIGRRLGIETHIGAPPGSDPTDSESPALCGAAGLALHPIRQLASAPSEVAA